MNAIQWKYQIIIIKGVVWRNFHFEGVCVIILCIHLPDDDVWCLFYRSLWLKKLNTALAVIQLIDKVQQKSEVKMHRITRTPNSSSLLNIHNCFSPMKFWVPINRSSVNPYTHIFFSSQRIVYQIKMMLWYFRPRLFDLPLETWYQTSRNKSPQQFVFVIRIAL